MEAQSPLCTHILHYSDHLDGFFHRFYADETVVEPAQPPRQTVREIRSGQQVTIQSCAHIQYLAEQSKTTQILSGSVFFHSVTA